MTEPARPIPAPAADPGLYGYLPYAGRPKITWPGGARIAVWVAPNIEFYEYAPPTNPSRTPWGRPLPDVLAYSHRDYGNRVGWQRMMKAMAAVGVRGSVSLNVALCDHHPEIIRACADLDWEFFSHGIYNTRYAYGMSEDQERAIIRDSAETIRRHTGQTMSGWLAPALSNTPATMDLLAEQGVLYTCDLFHDDQPTPINVKQGRLVSVPYSLEMNDVIVYNSNLYTPRHYGTIIRRQLDRREARQVFLLLLLVSEIDDWQGADSGLCTVRRSKARRRGDLLRDDERRDLVERQTAVFLGDVDRHQAERRALAEKLDEDRPVLLLQLGLGGQDLVRDEVLGRRGDHPVFFGEIFGCEDVGRSVLLDQKAPTLRNRLRRRFEHCGHDSLLPTSVRKCRRHPCRHRRTS